MRGARRGRGVINTHMTTQVVMSLSFSGATTRDNEFVKKKKKKKKKKIAGGAGEIRGRIEK